VPDYIPGPTNLGLASGAPREELKLNTNGVLHGNRRRTRFTKMERGRKIRKRITTTAMSPNVGAAAPPPRKRARGSGV